MDYSTPLVELKGVGEKTAKLFSKLNISNLGELLTTYPREYETFEDPVKIEAIHSGGLFTVYAAVTGIPNEKRVRNLSILNVTISDGTGSMLLTFFNMPFLKKTLKPGCFSVFRGNVQSRGTHYLMEQPRIYKLDDYRKLTDALFPKYPLTKGLTNLAFRKAVDQALSGFSFPEECYEDDFRHRYDLMTYDEAIRTIHRPIDYNTLAGARKRLVFDEFFSFLFFMRKNKEQSQNIQNQFCMFETADTVRFLEQLPYPLTKAQKRVWQEIRNDMSGPFCMNRLIQGDVGSGKTILALLALLMTAANGYQGAFMAPTEVLAIQHYETVCDYVKKYHLVFHPVLLVGSMSAKEKKEARDRIASGEVNIVIGTHALIQEKVEYHSLALVVTDEQHRFGVKQRENLAGKGSSPHILVMSATPIPRTLAIILYGDLHISVVDELPAGRMPIKNCVVNASYRPKAYKFISSEAEKGRQVYCICPQVEAGDSEDMENVVEYADKLRSVLPPSIRVAYLHGKMRPADKTRIMEEFAKHEIDVLVSTTVIEVGINVPNATVMMVENAERFGLAQLHQLRGRVGRGEHQSYCIFVSTSEKKETMERLEILNHSNDGFYIASQDLKLRGPGELFGIRQSGEFSFQIGDIYTDANVLQTASQAVDDILANDPELTEQKNRKLLEYLNRQASNLIDFRSI